MQLRREHNGRRALEPTEQEEERDPAKRSIPHAGHFIRVAFPAAILSEPRKSVSGGSSNELQASLSRPFPRPTSPDGRGEAYFRPSRAQADEGAVV